MRNLGAWVFPFVLSTLCVHAAYGQNYPSKYVRIVTTEPGSASDFASRLIAQRLSETLGQQVIVDNRGGGIAAIELVAKAQPDGYSLLLYGALIWLLPYMRDHVPWDPVRDFAPITLVLSSPNILVVHPSLPVKSVKDLIALAKAKPGELNYSSGPAGTSTHLAAELFKSMARVDIVRVPFKGNVPGLAALISGEVQLVFPTAGSGSIHVKSGRLRALAVTSAEPSALFPGLPTMAESGLPGYETVSILGMFAPAKTPENILRRLHQEIVAVVNRADVKEKLLSAGAEARTSTPEELAATVKAEMAKWSRIIKDAGIRAD